MSRPDQVTARQGGRLATLFLLAGALAGCAGTQKTYAPSADNNVHFTTVAESGVRVSVHVHSVDENCETNYEGTIRLAEASIATGIPVGRPSYLVFSFDSASFLANSRSSINFETMLTPQQGHDYRIAVEYVDDTYNATILAVNRQNNRRDEVHYTPLDTCSRGMRA